MKIAQKMEISAIDKDKGFGVAAELASEALPSSTVKTSSRPLVPDPTRPTFCSPHPPSPPHSLLFSRDRYVPFDPRLLLISSRENLILNSAPVMPESSIKRSLGVDLTRTIQEVRDLWAMKAPRRSEVKMIESDQILMLFSFTSRACCWLAPAALDASSSKTSS